MVSGSDPQISVPFRGGADRLFFPAAVCAGVAAVLSGGDRQGPGQSHTQHTRCARRRLDRHRGFRDGPRNIEDLPVLPCDEQDRCRTGGPLVSAPDRTAHCLFSGSPGRRFGCAGPRAREHPQLPDRLGPDGRDRPVLHRRLHRGDVRLLADPDLDRARDPSRSMSASPPARRRCSVSGWTPNSSAGPRTRRFWSRA